MNHPIVVIPSIRAVSSLCRYNIGAMRFEQSPERVKVPVPESSDKVICYRMCFHTSIFYFYAAE